MLAKKENTLHKHNLSTKSLAQVGDCQREGRWCEIFADLTASHAIEAKHNMATGPGASCPEAVIQWRK